MKQPFPALGREAMPAWKRSCAKNTCAQWPGGVSQLTVCDCSNAAAVHIAYLCLCSAQQKAHCAKEDQYGSHSPHLCTQTPTVRSVTSL